MIVSSRFKGIFDVNVNSPRSRPETRPHVIYTRICRSTYTSIAAPLERMTSNAYGIKLADTDAPGPVSRAENAATASVVHIARAKQSFCREKKDESQNLETVQNDLLFFFGRPG